MNINLTELSRKKTLIIWLIFTIIIGINVTHELQKNSVAFFQHPEATQQKNVIYTHPVTTVYRVAALNWMQGKDLYNHTGEGFIYLPQAATIYLPFALLPPLIQELLWRLLTIGTFIYSLYRISTLASPRFHRVFFLVGSIVCIPIADAAARSGQMNLLTTAVMLLALIAIKENHWWRAALLLVFSLALKPITIPLLLVTGTLFSKLSWRILIGLGILFLLPFLAQTPAYVVSQYLGAIQMLQEAAAFGSQNALHEWAQLFGLLSQLKLEFSPIIQNYIRITAALVTLILCLKAKKKYDLATALLFIYALTISYLMLFNPRTENNTYVMLAPAIGFFIARAFWIEQNRIKTLLYCIPAINLACAHPITKYFSPEHRWLQPLMALWFVGLVVHELFINYEARNTYIPQATRY